MKPQTHSPFRDLESPDEFEGLCRDLLGKSGDVEGAQKLFRKGHKQFGADVIAFERGGAGMVVGQCKWYMATAFTASDITEATKRFLEHWEKIWKPKNVVRFIIYVSQDLSEIEELDVVQTERARFLELGVNFDLLGEQRLIEELRPHRDIVRGWLDADYWESKINGAETRESFGFVSNATERKFITRNLEQQSLLLSEAIREPIEQIRQKARAGNVKEAIDELSSIKQRYFSYIDTRGRAEILSLEIRISFPLRMNLQTARSLLAQIVSEDSSFDTAYISALIAAEESGYEAGLKSLSITTEVATLNLKLAFLLNLGKGEDVCSIYERQTEVSPNAETKRLYAMGLLVVGRLTDAERIIDEAYNEEPAWEGVRLARALVLYHSSLSPGVTSENPLVFPSPQPWQLVKSDDESSIKRREAAQLFQGILEAEPTSENSRRLLQTWRLACLADDYEQFDSASRYAGDVLKSDPTNVYILIWALTRNLMIDFSIPLQAFEEKFSKLGQSLDAEINECILPLALYLRDGHTTKARTHFLRIKPVLSRVGESSLLAYWNCQIAIAEGKAVQVDKTLSQKIRDVNLRQRVQISALAAAYNQRRTRKTRRNLTKRLLKFYRKTRDAHYLSLYCQTCYGEKKWNEITRHADTLLTRTQTGESLYLVCSAFHQSNRYGKCLEYLERYKNFFPKGKMPAQLRRLKAYGLLRSGKLNLAAEEARRLWESEKSTDNFAALVETHRYSGDTNYIEEAIRDHKPVELSPVQKLQLAQILAPSNRDLATEFWRQALDALRETDTLLDALFYQGKQLGLDAEADKLVPQLFENAKGGKQNGKLLTLAETIEMMSERSKQTHELDLAYRQGNIPLHIYCEQRGLSLTYLLHQRPQLNASAEHFAQKYPILIHSAARTDSRDEALDKVPSGNYYLDVSSLLVAHHLNLLPLLERLTVPIFVSNEVIPFLDAELNQVKNITPAREQVAKIVTNLAQNQKLNVLESPRSLTDDERGKYDLLRQSIGERNLSMICDAIDRTAILVTYLPFHNNLSQNRDISLPLELSETTADWSVLVHKLLEEKCLGSETAESCRRVVNIASTSSEIDKIPFGSTLLLTGLVVAQYAELGILSEICQRYSVLLDGQDLEILKSDLTCFEQQEQLVVWIQTLKSHISRGFDQGLYEGISLDRIITDTRQTGKIREDYRNKPLLQLLALQDESEGVALVDDRFLTSFSTINSKLPLISVYELLHILKKRGLLSEEEFSQNLNQLREENFCYIPIASQEILTHKECKSSPSADDTNSFLQNHTLAILRRYYSMHLLDERWLKPPLPNQPSFSNYLAEIDFVFGYQRAVLDVLIQIWRDADSVEEARDTADRIVRDFYIGRFGTIHFYPRQVDSNDGALHLASDFVEMCLSGTSLLTLERCTYDQRIERLKHYLLWVENLFNVSLISSPEFVDYAVKHLETYLRLSNSSETRLGMEAEDDYQKIFVNLQLQLLNFLPDIVREKLYESTVLREFVQFNIESTVTVGPYTFETTSLWETVSAALLDKEASIKPRFVEEDLIATRKGQLEVDNAKITFTDSKGKTFDVGGSIVGLNLPSADLRLNYLKSLRNVLDNDDTTFIQCAEHIATIENASERADAFNAWAAKSMALAYETLDSQILATKSFNFSEIQALPILSLPNYFRIELISTDNFEEALDHGAESLLREVGLKEALNRLSLFPRRLPTCLVEECVRQPLAERRQILDDLHKRWRSPVGKIHYIFLALTLFPDNAEILEVVKREIGYLNGAKAEAEFEIFETLLDLVEVQFVRTKSVSSWTAAEKLAFCWAHASQLTNLVLPLTDNIENESEKLLKFLCSFLPFWYGYLFQPNNGYQFDVLSPKASSRETFTGFALGMMMQDIDKHLLDQVGLFDALRDVCFTKIKDAPTLKYHFWTDITNQSNVMGSWLGIEGFEAFCNLIGEDGDDDQMGPSWPSGITGYIVSTAEALANEHSVQHWQVLLFAAGGTRLNVKVQDMLPAIVRNLDFESVWGEDKRLSMAILGFLAVQWQILDDESRNKVRLLITWVVEQMEINYSFQSHKRFVDVELQRKIAFQIAQIVVPISQRGDTGESSKTWNDLILELGYIWPNLHVLLEPLFFRLWLEQPLDQIQGIGKNILHARINR